MKGPGILVGKNVYPLQWFLGCEYSSTCKVETETAFFIIISLKATFSFSFV